MPTPPRLTRRKSKASEARAGCFLSGQERKLISGPGLCKMPPGPNLSEGEGGRAPCWDHSSLEYGVTGSWIQILPAPPQPK